MEPGYLANVLLDLGPETCDRNTFLDILQQVTPTMGKERVEVQVAYALLMMAERVSEPAGGGWNCTTFGSAVLELVSERGGGRPFVHAPTRVFLTVSF